MPAKKSATTGKSPTSKPTGKKAAAKKAAPPKLASAAPLAIDPQIAAAARRMLIIVPKPGPLAAAANQPMAGMAAAIKNLASTKLPLKSLLKQKKAALESFMAQAMTSARGIATSTAGMAGAASIPASVQVLEGLGAIIADRSLVDPEALAAATGAVVVENFLVPLDTPVAEGASLLNLPAGADWHLANINVAAARAKKLDGKGIRIGILDTGIASNHPEFNGKNIAFAEFDMNGHDVTTTVRDVGTHGTHVSGIAAGRNLGVAPAADLAVAAVLTYLGAGGQLSGYFAQILAGLNWLLTHTFDPGDEPGVDVINASLGGVGYSDYLYSTLAAARMTTGTVLVGAVGNSGPAKDQHGSPGNYDIVAGVGAIDKTDAVASFSDWGTVPQHGGLRKPDVCAPGVQVWSSVPGGSYQPMNGTSMATPVVAGALALLLQQNHALMFDAPGLLQTLYSLVRPLKGPTNKTRGGRGTLDLTGI